MATTVAHASLIRYDDNGNQLVINLKNTGDDVSITGSTNSNLPAGATTVQGLANSLGALAFKNSLSKADVGLENVDNTADANKSVNYASTAGSATKVTRVKHLSTTEELDGFVEANAFQYATVANIDPIKNDGIILSMTWKDSTKYGHQIYIDDTSSLMMQRGRQNDSGTWGDWVKMIDSSNIGSQSVNYANTAGSANAVAWDSVTGKPSTYTPSSHTHTKSQITDFPTSMPASDVSAWAKAASKPSYSKSEVGLALMESTAMAVGFGRQGLLKEFNFVNAAIVVLTLTAGSTFLMWIGERITEKGVGNGISIVLVINIISRIPSDMTTLFTKFVKGKSLASGGLAVVIIVAIILVLVVFVVVLQDGERRIAVQYSQKVMGRRTYGGQSTNIPLKVNTAGVIPIIFASSLMQFPIVIATFAGKGNGTGIGSEILRGLNQGNWCNPQMPKYSWGLAVYIILTVFFAYFYTSITFNPLEIANNMKKNGGFIPGIRPGKPTVEYLTKILNYIIFVGACGLVLIQLVPIIFNGWLGASVSFGGTSLIIIVSVILETLKQIESQMLVRNYKGFLNK